ncbi:AI-2E family transporter [Fibrobacter sp.]|uniref:AI-2E family transporter n=1 Tax=Fibrobacter sp. TaxID=35828 RepID=UPI0025F54593|nr:AI-2E family transporter [Fibrobacter sp.]MDD7498154.1 AI-2E family transporter [Fibrobacter sp.]MDY5725050.1 AI-2E family transporter [Fibrobacter sp.]
MIKRIWTIDRVMRLLFMATGLGILLWILNYLSAVLAPFFAAFLMAYIFDPLVCKIQNKVKYRVVAVAIVISMMVLVIGGAMWIFIPMVVGEIRHLGALIQKLFSDSTWMERLSAFVPQDLWREFRSLISWDKVAVAMQSLDFWNAAQSVAGKVLPSAWGVVTKTSSLVMWLSGVGLIFMYLVFIMLDMPKLRKGVKNLFPTRYKQGASEFAMEMDRFMGSYFRAQSFVALSVGILYAIGFGVIGLPMGVAFGLFSGALNMIPYLQLTTIPLALLLAVVYALEKGMPFWEVAIIVLVIYLVVQLIQDMILVPKIVGSSMNLPPVGILLSLSIWGKLLGFLGLIVAIPFTCLCLVYIEKIQKKADAIVESDVEPPPEA